eukprot:2250150-Rhodomonas_salina.1
MDLRLGICGHRHGDGGRDRPASGTAAHPGRVESSSAELPGPSSGLVLRLSGLSASGHTLRLTESGSSQVERKPEGS